MADPPNSDPPGGGRPDSGGQSGNLGQRKRIAPKTPVTQGAGSPREDQSFLKNTEQFTHGGDSGGQSDNLGQKKRFAQKTPVTQGAGSPREDQSFLKDTEQSTHGGDSGGQSDNLGQRKRFAQKTSGTQGAGSPREDQSFLKNTEQSTHGGGAYKDSGKASSSTDPLSTKPTIYFKFGSNTFHTVESPLSCMQWKHLFNQEKELDKMRLVFKAECKEDDKDGNITIFTSERPQGDVQQLVNGILGRLKTLSSKMCSTKLVMDSQDLRHFDEQWSKEECHQKNLVTCFYDRSSPRSTVIVFSDDKEVLQEATKSANAILDSLQEVAIEVPWPHFDDQCFQHFIQLDKFPNTQVCLGRRDGKTCEIKLHGPQAERDRASRKISQVVAALEMEQVNWPEARVWMSRTENGEYLRKFMEEHQPGILPIIGEGSLFLIGPKNNVGEAQQMLQTMLCTKEYLLSKIVWKPLMENIRSEYHSEETYFIPAYHLLASHDPSKEQLKLAGPLGFQCKLLQKNVQICLKKPAPEVLAALNNERAIKVVSTTTKEDSLEIEGPAAGVQEAFQLIAEAHAKAQSRASEETLPQICMDRLVTLLLMKPVATVVNDSLTLPGKDFTDVTWKVDGKSRHLQVKCKDRKRRDEAEIQIKSLFGEKEIILEDLNKAAADRLHESWPALVTDLHEFNECCFATFEPDRKLILLATLRDRFDQTSKKMVHLMQFYQKNQAVKTLKLTRAQFKYLMKEHTKELENVKKQVEGNGGTFALQAVGSDDDYLQVSVTGAPTVVSPAVHTLHHLQGDIHLVEAKVPDAVMYCLEAKEEGTKFVSHLEEKYKCYIDFPKALVDGQRKMPGNAEVVLDGGTKVSLQHGPLKAEGMDLVVLPVPLEMESKTKSAELPGESSKILADVRTQSPDKFEKVRKGKEKVILVTSPKNLPCRKVALMAVPSQWNGQQGEKAFVRSNVRELMEMMMREKLSSVAFETPIHLPKAAAENQILVGLCEFFKEEAGQAAPSSGIKFVSLITDRLKDPSQLLMNAFSELITSRRIILVAGADQMQLQEAAHELSKFVPTAPEEIANSVDGRGTEEEMQNYSKMDVSTSCPNLKRRVFAPIQESIFDEVGEIMKKLVGCYISNQKGNLYLHFPVEKKDLAIAVCQHFDNLISAVEPGVPSSSSSTTQQSEYDEILVNAAGKFFQNFLRKFRVTKRESGKVVLTPALSKKDLDLISSLQLTEVQVNDHEKEKAQTIYSVFQKEADIHVEYVPSKKVVAAVVRKYDQLQAVISRVKVHLGQVKTAYRGKRQFTTRAESSDQGITGASAAGAVESSEEATEEASGGDSKITLPGGLEVIPYRTDITKVKVDAIVNAANERLGHGGGVARAILDAAGPDLDQEGRDYIDLNGTIPVSGVCITGPGRLPCTRVIHAVGPRWDDRTPEVCRKQLYDTVMNCCREAEKWELGEIAMPPISSGIFGMPKDQCTEMYCKALLDFDQQANKKLKTIHFVDINDDMPQALLKALKKEIAQGQQRTGSAEADVDLGEGCVICTGREFDQPVKLNDCNHVFCKACIEQWFQTKPTCPSCNKVYGIITGTMPGGTMKTRRDGYIHLAGFENYGRIEINYSFFDGIQQAEHPNPGQPYKGARRIAYLPDNAEGRKVLRLLEEAWERRLTFTIGRSTTTGQENVVTWNDIHHKTSTVPGHSFGYPDPNYLKRVQEELAALGVTEESIKMAQSGKAQDFSQFYTPVRPRRTSHV